MVGNTGSLSIISWFWFFVHGFQVYSACISAAESGLVRVHCCLILKRLWASHRVGEAVKMGATARKVRSEFNVKPARNTQVANAQPVFISMGLHPKITETRSQHSSSSVPRKNYWFFLYGIPHQAELRTIVNVTEMAETSHSHCSDTVAATQKLPTTCQYYTAWIFSHCPTLPSVVLNGQMCFAACTLPIRNCNSPALSGLLSSRSLKARQH